MNGISARFQRNSDDIVAVQVSLNRGFALADQKRFIHLEAVQGKAILLRIDRDACDFEFGGGAHDPDGDFATIGHQQTFYFAHDV